MFFEKGGSVSARCTVGLILITEINGNRWAALVRRGRHKIEEIHGKKKLLGESYIGLSQPTVSGGMKTSEIKSGEAGLLGALKREMSEETNLDFQKMVGRMICVLESQNKLRRSIIFAAFATEAEVLDLKFEPCKSLNPIRENEVADIRTDARREGFFEPGIAMFPEDKEALLLAFGRFEELQKLFEQKGGGDGNGNR